MKKLMHFRKNFINGSEDMNQATMIFPLLADFLTVNNTLTHVIAGTVWNYLQQLSHYFNKYFVDDDVSAFGYIRNTFECQLTDLTGCEQEQLAELSSDRPLGLRFAQNATAVILGSMFPGIFVAFRQSHQSPTIFFYAYLCENGVSVVTAIKTKYRYRLDIEDDIQICLSGILPRLDKFCSSK
ncbi:Zinc finger BED domain-containing protein 5 [Thelohanellus kitauei]|uniref:Zinc finger BED domain-containing protein 5 n=1 Tax=Thelohanellus kitauei TaxID=669202 RepID=A0A0C2J0P9_THEKT|nr:Zinc finger BED domain-containing protein 5 [Thelohanellus kitauei]